MKCPHCNSETKVVDKRMIDDSETNRRRRECLKCGKRFTTYERVETEQGVTQIKKRNGAIVDFDPEKITTAIFKAAQAVGGNDKEEARKVTDLVVKEIEKRFIDSVPDVETVQDTIERVLIEAGHAKTAKAYILYRDSHKKIRESKNSFVDVQNTVSRYLDKSDWAVKENSNEAFSFSGLLLYTAGEVMKTHNLNEMYTQEIADAHRKGYFHIHDLSYGVIGYSFYRNETIVVRERHSKKILNLSLEQFYNLVNARMQSENGFEIKYTGDYEVLDENGWTGIKRVLRHKTTKPLMSFNTYSGHNLIVTDDHPFITLEQEKPIVCCSKCESTNVIKNKTNKTGKDYFICKDCNQKFGLPVSAFPDLKKRKEVYARDIKMQNYALHPKHTIDTVMSNISLSPLDGWFIGLFTAEGYFKKSYISFELKKGTMECNKLLQYLKSSNISYNLCSRKINLSNGQIMILDNCEENMIIDIHMTALPFAVQHCISQIRPYSENKNLPNDFLNFSPESIGGMVSGLIDGDGVIRNDDQWVSRANIRITSKTLLSQVQTWFRQMGINSSLSTIDSYGERNHNGRKIEPKKQLYSLTVYIPENRAELFKESVKIDSNFKFSRLEAKTAAFSSFRKIEEIQNDDEYVYDITTNSHTFFCNGILVHNCAGWSLKNLLLMGFGGVPNKVDCKPAKHMNTVVHQMVNYIGCLQMEFAGAQAFSSVDTLLAPFVKVDQMQYKEVKQCIQQLVFSLNIPSRWGSQYPFSNLTFDWTVPKDMKDQPAIVGGVEQDFKYGDCQKEMDTVNKAFLEVMIEGDAKGSVFTFPIPTYNLTKDFEWDSPNANLLFDLTAKYGLPYFQNYIGSNLDPSSIRAMCCRLNLNQRELMNRPGGMWSMGDSTGSVGVVTLNLNRIGYEAKNEEEYFKKLEYYMNLAKDSLEVKRKIVEKNLARGLMPFTKRYLGTFRNHFSTIGLCGMHESCLNFLKVGIETPKGIEFTKKVLNFMRDRMKDYQEQTGNLYNLEATPAESTSYRFARLDRQMYPNIICSGKAEPYLTNSTALPVDHTDDLISALEHQNEIQPLYTGGTMFHTFLGERMADGESCKRLVKKMAYNTRLPYFSITPTFSVCKDHGYLKGEQCNCPECGEETEVWSRIVGYFRPIQNWNNGKQEEFKDRIEYSTEKAMTNEFKTKIEKALEKAIEVCK